jgi:hypothetical protein
MIEKPLKKRDLKKVSSIKEDLAYWLSKTPQERIEAIEFLRGQYHSGSCRRRLNSSYSGAEDRIFIKSICLAISSGRKSRLSGRGMRPLIMP